MRSTLWILFPILWLAFAGTVSSQGTGSCNRSLLKPSPLKGSITSDAMRARAAVSPVSLGLLAAGAKTSLPDFGEKPSSVTDLNVDLRLVAKPEPPIATLPLTREEGSLRLTLPSHLEPGQYYFTLKDKTVILGIFEIAPEKVKLTSIYPATSYRDSRGEFNFDIEGENFSTEPNNDDVTDEGRRSIVETRRQSKEECATLPACLWVQSDHEMHLMNYSAKGRYGPLSIGVTVGGTTHAADAKRIVLARFSGGALFSMSAVLTGLLFGAVSWVVSSGLKNNKVRARKLSFWATFIFDPETSSYSLARFQLLAFSFTFIFAYFYILLCQWFVQWQFVQPNVSQTIAGLLGISGATTVASAGLTAARGAKGAGLEQPTGADLISTGGVVVPERFQFFAWTLVFCGGFFALLIGKDPAAVNGYPDIPTGLLYIMGVSATGYLAGKATRKPGPILEYVGVEDLAVPKQAGARYWLLTAQGQNLGSDGAFLSGKGNLT